MDYRVTSKNLDIVFDESGVVRSVMASHSDYDFMQCPAPQDGIWLLNLIHPVSYNDPVPPLEIPDLEHEGHEWWANRHEHLAERSIDSASLAPPTVTEVDAGIQFTWQPVLPESPDSAVTLTVQPDDDNESIGFRIEVSIPDNWAIKKVDFPRIRGLGNLEQAEADSVLLPFNWGILRNNPLEAMLNMSGQYPSGFNSMQMTALFHGDNGLYLGIHDPDCNNTGISIQYVEGSQPTPYMSDRWHTPDDKAVWQTRERQPLSARISQNLTPSLCLQCHHWPVMSNTWKSPYAVKLRAFTGNWYDAAMIHKPWATRQHWCSRGRLYDRQDRSERLLETDLWFCQYGFHPGSFDPEPAWKFQREIHELHDFFGMPFGLHWYNWHNFSWHSQYPNHQPPVEGFEEVAKELQSRGIVLMPYCQGRLLYRDRENFEEERTHANLEANGQPYLEKYTSGDDWPLALCPGDSWSRQQWFNAAEMLWKQYGVEGVYFDQISAMPPSLCYHQGHGHPLGGGNFYWQGYHQFLQSLRPFKEEDPNRFVSSECLVDAFIGDIDVYLSFVPPLDDLVPLFAAVYGEYTTMMGRSTPDAIMKDLQLFVMTQGEQLLFGGMVGWVNTGILRYSDSAAYLRKLGTLRRKIRDFLNFGTMARPLTLDISGEPLKVTIPAQVCFHKQPVPIQRPAVLNTVWHHPDGRRLLLMLNESNGTRNVTIPEAFLQAGDVLGIYTFDGQTDLDVLKDNSIDLAPFDMSGIVLSK